MGNILPSTKPSSPPPPTLTPQPSTLLPPISNPTTGAASSGQALSPVPSAQSTSSRPLTHISPLQSSSIFSNPPEPGLTRSSETSRSLETSIAPSNFGQSSSQPPLNDTTSDLNHSLSSDYVYNDKNISSDSH
ncbi:hypothetical protein MVEN_01324200 [Mycena venus]|uniref:Uncharacterized protein n=1 Tax=Mycena venus TaxID=2733690 RepID=A0A8H6Y1D6_9AGAR|nr:hypothetical protein MVEN_01324200 [Mycena venus]